MLEQINEYGKVTGYKFCIKKSIVCLYKSNNQKEKLGKKNSFIITPKIIKMPRNKFN